MSRIKSKLSRVTVVEMLITIAIIGILEAIAQPKYGTDALMVALTSLISFFLIIAAGFDVKITKRT